MAKHGDAQARSTRETARGRLRPGGLESEQSAKKSWDELVADEVVRQQKEGQPDRKGPKQTWLLTIGITVPIAVAVFVVAQLYCEQHRDETPITLKLYDDMTEMWHDLPHKKDCPAVSLAWQMIWASQEGKDYLTKRVLDEQIRRAGPNDPALQRWKKNEGPGKSSYDWKALTSEKSQRQSKRKRVAEPQEDATPKEPPERD
jgi:hypothetical protein